MIWRKWIIPLGILLYGVSLFAMTWGVNGLVNSPDEAANAFFALQFAEAGSFIVDQPLSEASYGLLHPRSMVTVFGALLPGSFLGLPFFAGILGWIFGEGAIYFVTPLLLVLALFAWRNTVKHLFGSERLANLATFFLALHPGVWYYGMRVMMHNIGFLAFLIFALWFFIVKPVRIHTHWKSVDALLGGAMLGFALFFRGSEVIWVLGAFAMLSTILFLKKKLGWSDLLAAIFGLFLGLLPLLYLNGQTYGNLFTTGYTAAESFIEVTANAGAVVEDSGRRSLLASILFPFGFHERVLLRNSWRYLFTLYPWISLISVLGFVWFLRDKEKRKMLEWKLFAMAGVLISCWLVFMYGSWVVHDNPDPNAITLANSYVRYWLPIFLIGSVFAAYAIERLWQHPKKQPIYLSAVLGLILICIAGLSANLVWMGTDGVLETRNSLEQFEQKRDQILMLTEEESIIIVDYADKYLFPHRQVVTPLRSEATYTHLPALRELAPLYYYGITLPEEDLVYLQEQKLAELGLTIYPVEEIQNETLYHIDYPR